MIPGYHTGANFILSFPFQAAKLQVVPLDLVGFQMEVEGGGVGVDGGILGNVGVVDHAVLTVGNESVDFHVIVGGEPRFRCQR